MIFLRCCPFHRLWILQSLPHWSGLTLKGGVVSSVALVPTGLMPRLALARISYSKTRMRAEGAPSATPYPEEAEP